MLRRSVSRFQRFSPWFSPWFPPGVVLIRGCTGSFFAGSPLSCGCDRPHDLAKSNSHSIALGAPLDSDRITVLNIRSLHAV